MGANLVQTSHDMGHVQNGITMFIDLMEDKVTEELDNIAIARL